MDRRQSYPFWFHSLEINRRVQNWLTTLTLTPSSSQGLSERQPVLLRLDDLALATAAWNVPVEDSISGIVWDHSTTYAIHSKHRTDSFVLCRPFLPSKPWSGARRGVPVIVRLLKRRQNKKDSYIFRGPDLSKLIIETLKNDSLTVLFSIDRG